MFNKKTLVAAVLLSVLSAQAEAQIITADGQWNAFDVDEEISGGLEWIDLDGNPLTFDFTLTDSAVLDVVDAGFGGDRFGLSPFIIEQVIGYQERTGNNTFPSSVVLDFDQAYTDLNYSLYTYTLLPGTYSLTGLLIESALDGAGTPINATVGAVRLTSAVPLPAAAWLYMGGTALMGFISRRRKV